MQALECSRLTVEDSLVRVYFGRAATPAVETQEQVQLMKNRPAVQLAGLPLRLLVQQPLKQAVVDR